MPDYATYNENYLRRSDVEQLAEKITRAAGVWDRFPAPLEEIARSLAYESSLFTPPPDDPQMNGISGMVHYGDKRILVNGGQSLGRQRFTLAHEIGHIALNHEEGNDLQVDYRADMDYHNPNVSAKEAQANQFAAALLMPRKEFVTKWFSTRGNVELLSAYFGVSEDSLLIRKKILIDDVI